MNWKHWLFSHMFLRNMLTDIVGRSFFFPATGSFTPYFQYKTGYHQPGYYLYFSREPSAAHYKNEIFNKLHEFNGHDVVLYLEFHYRAYPDHPGFLAFLQSELSVRLSRTSRSKLQPKLKQAMAWVQVQQKELEQQSRAELLRNTDTGFPGVLPEGAVGEIQRLMESSIRDFSDKVNLLSELMLNSTRENLENLTGFFVTGHIELNNHGHEEKLLQLFILLQTVQAPPRIARAEQLFKRFSATDIASILRLHFESFKNKQINTLQVKIREAGERLNPQNPKVQKLSAALQEFFY